MSQDPDQENTERIGGAAAAPTPPPAGEEPAQPAAPSPEQPHAAAPPPAAPPPPPPPPGPGQPAGWYPYRKPGRPWSQPGPRGMVLLVGVLALVVGLCVGVGATVAAVTFRHDMNMTRARPAPAAPYGPYGRPGPRGGFRRPAPMPPKNMPAQPQPSPKSS